MLGYPLKVNVFDVLRSISLSSLNPIGQTIFELESGNENVDKQMDGQTDEKQTNERTEFHQYRKEPTYDGDLSPYQV